MSIPVVSGITTTLDFVTSVVARLFRNNKNSSLVSFTKSTRVEPIVLIDRRLAPLPYLGDIMQSLSSIFSGYYLQAVALMTHINSINVVRALDSLNPNRDVNDAAATYIVDRVRGKGGMMGVESYALGLPTAIAPKKPVNESFSLSNVLSFESQFTEDSKKVSQQLNNADVVGATDTINRGTAEYHSKKLEGSVGHVNASVSDAAKVVNEAVNLSVGKLLSVEIGDKNNRATFPIMVRLIATYIDASILAHILGAGNRNSTAKERYHAWRSGQLAFWRDLVFCQDLIDEHKKALLKDDTGAYAEIHARGSKNQLASTLTDTPSIGTAANLLVVSKQTIREVEREIGGSFDNLNVRNKIFNSSNLMIVVVVDPDYEQVSIYHRDIKLPSRLSVKELKVSNKGTGPDVAEILKAYMLGNQVSI